MNVIVCVKTESIPRDRESDNEDWEEKEASRTHSVKFTEDVPETREVSIWCCYTRNIFHSSSRHTPYVTPKNKFRQAYKTLRYEGLRFHKVGNTFRQGCGLSRAWFRNNVSNRFSMHRAYLTLSTILVALE